MDEISVSGYLGLLTNIAALVLSIVAIWLSIVFFKMSSSLAEDSKEAAKGIGASVDRLEKLFDKLYADTFSMMRDTVSDMRRHIWPNDTSDNESLTEEIEQRTEEKLADLRSSFENELAQLLSSQMEQNDQLASVRSLLDRAIDSTKEVTSEVREEALRDQVEAALQGKSRLQMMDILVEVGGPTNRVIEELEKMEREDLVFIDGLPSDPRTLVLISPRLRSKRRRLAMRESRNTSSSE